LTAGLQVGASALVVAESTSDYGFVLVPAGLSTAAFVSGTIMFSSFAGWNLGRASLQDRDPRTVSRRRTAAWATGGTLLGVGLGALAGGVALGLRAPSERLQLAGVASAAFSYLPLSLAAGAFAYVGGLRGPRRRLSLTPRMEVPLEGGWSAGLGLSGWF
jgi:hypothetical protein